MILTRLTIEGFLPVIHEEPKCSFLIRAYRKGWVQVPGNGGGQLGRINRPLTKLFNEDLEEFLYLCHVVPQLKNCLFSALSAAEMA